MTKEFESNLGKEMLNDVLGDFKGEMKGLLGKIAETGESGQKKAFISGAIKQEKLSNADACFMCARLDHLNLSKIPEKDRNLVSLIVNNGRGEGLEEMYNTDKKHEIRNLFESLIRVA